MMHHIYGHLTKELDKKAEKGLTSTADLDVVVRLTEAMKNLAKADYYCTVTEAMNDGEYSHGDGYSERRRRDSMGRYAREGAMHHSYEGDSSYRDGRDARRGGYSEARGEYMDAKHSYRSTRSPESKRDMTASLEECKHKLRQEMQNMLNDADTREEREAIKTMIREIGSLA